MLSLTVASLDRPFVSGLLLNSYYTFDVYCDVPSLIGFSAVQCLKFASCVLSLRIRTLTCRRFDLLLRVRPILLAMNISYTSMRGHIFWLYKNGITFEI